MRRSDYGIGRFVFKEDFGFSVVYLDLVLRIRFAFRAAFSGDMWNVCFEAASLGVSCFRVGIRS